jgi:hypothetical protein
MQWLQSNHEQHIVDEAAYKGNLHGVAREELPSFPVSSGFAPRGRGSMTAQALCPYKLDPVASDLQHRLGGKTCFV